MTLLDSYLLFLDEQQAKLKALIAAGKLSAAGIEKARKLGYIQSKAKYLQGLKTGTENIQKKYGAIIRYSDDAAEGPGVTYSKTGQPIITKLTKRAAEEFEAIQNAARIENYLRKKGASEEEIQDVIYKVLTKKQKSRRLYRDAVPYMDRHEADEIRTTMKIANKYGISPNDILQRGKGPHVSPKVLKREKQYSDYARNAYGTTGKRQSGTKLIDRARKAELQGKDLKKMFSSRGIRKYDKATYGNLKK